MMALSPNKSIASSPQTLTVGARMTLDEVEKIDAAARAAHLDRSAYIRRVLKGRAIRFYPMEMLLAEAVALFCTMRISVELGRPDGLADAFDRLDALLDRLCVLSMEEPRP
ncbi:plasmid mobilization protein [Sphingobium olei]|uniref:Ribbon-helix-helix protein, CopG family n=2 Tax=Sphingobium olei TaxID=420955 RepID=A0ABW3NY33_9SPHN